MTFKKFDSLVMKLVTIMKLLFLEKINDMCLPFPQRFEKTFAHESKY